METRGEGVLSRCGRLRIQHCHCSSSACCCGTGLIPGLGVSICYGSGQKKKKKKNRGEEIIPTAERGEYMENIKEKKRNMQDRLRRTKCWRMYLGFVLISTVRNADMEMTVMKEEVVVATDP